MSIIDELETAGNDIPGTELFELETANEKIRVLARRVQRPKNKGSVGETQTESDGLWMNVYTKHEIKIGDKLRRISDSVAYGVDSADASWRGRRQTVRCKRIRGRVD